MTLDPALFRPEAIDPETAAFNEALEKLLNSVPLPTTMTAQQVRAEREAGRGPFGPIVRSPDAIDRSIDGPAGPLRVRVLQPKSVQGVYLHIHGGGWALGAADLQDPLLDGIAKASNVAVVSVDYRLAPEHPYPAGPDDCEAAALWLAKNARAEFGTDRLVIGGESAGAHLAAVTLLRLRDRHGLRPFAGANFAYGVFDVAGTPSVRHWGDRYLALNGPMMKWYADMFVPEVQRRDPDVSPLHADLRDMSAALFTVGTLDPLLDDTLFMHARWLAAGNEAQLAVYPGGVHGLNNLATKLARGAVEREQAFICQVTGNK